jgi:hypothetical protein
MGYKNVVRATLENTTFYSQPMGSQGAYRHVIAKDTPAREGWQTKDLREKSGLKKTKGKSKQSFESHSVDAFILAASISGASTPTCTRLWYVVPAVLHRRQLHRLQASSGGIRKPYGGTRSLGLRRGTVVKHKKYGLCTRRKEESEKERRGGNSSLSPKA